MKHFLTLLKWDILLLGRNKLFLLAAVVAGIYVGVFYLLKPLGNLDIMLVVLIFNDPVVTGFLFAGILLLFDKSQNTLQAISVLPLPFRQYLLSKITVLSVLATVLGVIMAIAIRGLHFNLFHLTAATFFSSFIFASLGCIIGAISKNFNQLLFYCIPFFIVAGLPLLSLFGYGQPVYFALVPSMGGIGLLQASLQESSMMQMLPYYAHLLAWCYISWKLAVTVNEKQLA